MRKKREIIVNTLRRQCEGEGGVGGWGHKSGDACNHQKLEEARNRLSCGASPEREGNLRDTNLSSEKLLLEFSL